MPTDVRAVAEVFLLARANPERGMVASVLPLSFVMALADPFTLLRGGLGIHPTARLFVESQGRMRAAALVYLRTTPHAVQRAEQLTVTDFDLDRRAGALAPPHLLEGNPLSMRRGAMLITRDGQDAIDATYVGFHGRGVHPHVCKLRTAHVD